MTLEERIEDAIVARFFEPSWTMSTQPIYDATGAVRHELVPMQMPAPMTTVAQAVYDAAKERIIARVLAQLDIDDLVEQWAPRIAKDVVDKLQTQPNSWSANPSVSERKKMLDKVYEQVAEEFGRQCVERLRETGGLLAVLEAPGD